MKPELIALLLCTAAMTAQPVDEILSVPKGPAPTIDGNIADAEWAGSAVSKLSDGSEVLLRHDGMYLYLAVRAVKDGYVSACVISGDTVRILHASAALGLMRYVRAETSWALKDQLPYALRDRSPTPEARAHQREYLAENQWLGSTFTWAPNRKEMQISLRLLGTTPRIGFGYNVINEPVRGWPVPLSDGCVETRLVQGYPPAHATFEPEHWMSLQIQK